LLGVRWGILLAREGIIFYTILVGAEAAVVRAAIMGGTSMLLTNLQGWIQLETDGERLWVEVERNTS
jgi:predicted membrane metal-binding protein